VARLLIAEDDKAVRDFVTRALRQEGHDIMAVNDGMQALDALSQGSYALLLSDIVMPRLDGIALALKVASDHPDLPILLMTGYAAERQRAHDLEVMIHEVIIKPFTLDQICKATSRSLRQ
jgi:two-component system, cell cycle response regulator CpdR